MSLLEIKTQLLAIKSGGVPVLKRKLSRILELFLVFIAYIPIFILLILLRLISPLIHIRFGFLTTERIGHLAMNTELYLCEVDQKQHSETIKKYTFDFWLEGRSVCNQYLLQAWAQKLTILKIPYFISRTIILANSALPKSHHFLCSRISNDRDINNVLLKSPSRLKLPNDDLRIAWKELKKFGIQKTDRWVCLQVRDSAYLDELTGTNNANLYHSYRDCSINDFLGVAEFLANQGIYVFRMGRVANQRLISSNPLIIDYAFSDLRSDLLDMVLGSGCFFCLTTGSGFDAIPQIFRRPILEVNYLPIGHMRTFLNNSMCLARKLRFKNSSEFLSLEEIFKFGFAYSLSTEEYESLEIVSNTPEEILNAATEFLGHISQGEKSLFQKTAQEKFINKFKYCIKMYPPSEPLHGSLMPMNYSSQFIHDNPEWLD
jgi:putative glycosyltransferase (TIGR04372 family)